jgi:hypothetical protein
VISVPTKMLTREERDVQPLAIAPRPVEAKPSLSWRDLAGTAVAVLVVFVYAANLQGWWYLGSNRSAAVTLVAIGVIGCSLGARLVGENLTSLPIIVLGLLGAAALALAILAIVTATQWALLALAIVVIALWAGATLRHAVTPPPRLVAH